MSDELALPMAQPVDLADLKYVYVELTVKCNLKCHFCDNSMRNLYRDMPGDRFRQIISQLAPGTRLGLHGLGEPTLHRELLDLIAFAKERGLYVYFNSNHTVTSDEQMKGFVDHGLDELRVSMSAATRESFRGYSGRDLYDQLLERAQKMVAFRGNRKKPLLRAVFVLTKQSYPEFPAVARTIESIGFDELQVQTFLNWGKPQLPDEPEDGCALSSEELAQVRRMVTDAALAVKGVRVILPFAVNGAEEDPSGPGRAGRCQWPFNATWITADGHVTPCCNLHDPRQVSLGNAFEGGLDEIWLGERYQAFRREYRCDNIEACRSCPIHYGKFKTYTYESAPPASL